MAAQAKKRWRDHYTDKARQAGFAARSVFKLEEIDRRLGLVRPGLKVLDLGASPGSWTQYVLQRLAGSGQVVAVDLKPLQGVGEQPSLTFLEGDIFDFSVEELQGGPEPFDLVLSDMAPATIGSRTADTLRSAALCERVVDVADACLRPGGGLLLKLLEGQGTAQLRSRLKQDYASLRAFRPDATRKASSETFLYAIKPA